MYHEVFSDWGIVLNRGNQGSLTLFAILCGGWHPYLPYLCNIVISMIHSSSGRSCYGECRLAREDPPVGLFYYSLARLKSHRLQGQDSEVDVIESRQPFKHPRKQSYKIENVDFPT